MRAPIRSVHASVIFRTLDINRVRLLSIITGPSADLSFGSHYQFAAMAKNAGIVPASIVHSACTTSSRKWRVLES
jgi:hypothetical protein